MGRYSKKHFPHLQTAAVSEDGVAEAIVNFCDQPDFQFSKQDKIAYVQQALQILKPVTISVTDAIEEVKRLRDAWLGRLPNSSDATFKYHCQTRTDAANEIITALSALQAKAGGSERDEPPFVSPVTSSTKIKARLKDGGQVVQAPIDDDAQPAQQSPRVCVRCGHNDVAAADGRCNELTLGPVPLAGMVYCNCQCVFP